VFREVASGAKTDCAQLRKALAQPEPGDVLMVTRLDRLARSTRDLLNTLAAITGKEAGFRSLGDTWADTSAPRGPLMLTPLASLDEFEREPVRARMGESRPVPRWGVRIGRKPKLTRHQRKEALARRETGEHMRWIAQSYNVSHSTIFTLDR
jgi:DNA invertase Pin-like site-specific DNA recombinase